MLTRRESHVCRNLVVVVVIFFAFLGGRDRNLFGKSLAIKGELETGGRTCGSHGSKHRVVARFLHVHGPFEPIAFAVVAHDYAGSLLVEVNARILAVVAIAVIFGIVAIGLVARAVFIDAHARDIEIFGFDLTRERNHLALERELRFGLHRSEGHVVFTLAQVLREVIFEPVHGSALAAIFFNKAGVCNPGRAVDITPNGNACNPRSFPHERNLVCVIVFLFGIVRFADIVFRNEKRKARLVMDSSHLAFEIGLAHALTVVSLLTVSIDRSAVLDDGLDEFDTFVDLPGKRVVVVIDKYSFRPTFAGHLEGVRDKVVLVLAIYNAVTTEGFDNVGAAAFGIVGAVPFGTCSRLAVTRVIVVTRPNSFVHHVDVFEVGKLGGNGIEPFGDVLFGEFYGNARIFLFAKEVRVLGTPNEGVELEVAFARFFLGPLVGAFALVEVVPSELACTAVAVRKGMNRAPLTAVFGSDLVPVLRKVATNLAARSNIAQEFCTAIGHCRISNSRKACNGCNSKREG